MSCLFEFYCPCSSHQSICRLDLDFFWKKTMLSTYSSFYSILLSLVPFAMPVCHSLSCFWHLVQDSLCSRPVSILNLHHSPLLFSMFRVSFPAFPLTPSLQQASFSALILSYSVSFFPFFPLTLFLPILSHFSSSSPYLALCMASSPHIPMFSTPPRSLPGSMAGLFFSSCGLPLYSSCFPCPSY